MNYKKQLVSFKMEKFAIFSLLLFFVAFVVCALINVFLIKNPLLITSKVYFDILILLAGIVIGIVIHELIHALTGIIVAKQKRSDISFGMNIKQGVFYCFLGKPMKAWQYIIVLLAPVVFTGIIPLIISTLLGNIFLVLLFSFLVSGGAGDIIMALSLVKKDKNIMVLDHNALPAYYLMYEEDKLPENFVETSQEEEDKLITAMKENPYGSQKGKKNSLIKILLITVFLCAVAVGLVIMALLLKLI